VINLSLLPCPDGYFVLHEPAWGRLCDRVCEVAESADPTGALSRALMKVLLARDRAVKETYVCPTCHRWLVLDSESGTVAAVWTQEGGEPQALLRQGCGASEAAAQLACPSCGNSEVEDMVYVEQVRICHRMRLAEGSTGRGAPERPEPLVNLLRATDGASLMVEVELDRVDDEKILGKAQIECRRCYVVFVWPEDVGAFSLHPSHWG